ncbi:MAG: leucine-rich repeat protein [Lachnospiraceae bacterium]|nr:leucine-rich repeat protein [bacterium]MDY5517318.1 leucine-rich repeat protein [Lachnospiraceae bacterium]
MGQKLRKKRILGILCSFAVIAAQMPVATVSAVEVQGNSGMERGQYVEVQYAKVQESSVEEEQGGETKPEECASETNEQTAKSGQGISELEVSGLQPDVSDEGLDAGVSDSEEIHTDLAENTVGSDEGMSDSAESVEQSPGDVESDRSNDMDKEQDQTEHVGDEDPVAEQELMGDLFTVEEPEVDACAVTGSAIMPDEEAEMALLSTELTYTDEQGNVFTYEVDEQGKATITGICVSGTDLIIPETLGGAAVAAVDNGADCVISNPGVRIPKLEINCPVIGVKAFSGLSIGTLIIGENVKTFSVVQNESYTFQYYYEQFLSSEIDQVIFRAVEMDVSYQTESESDKFYGPFHGARVGSLLIGDEVALIPELLFQGAYMDLETLELQTGRIGAYAFSGRNISIGHLILGEQVRVLEEYSNSSQTKHDWGQFAYATIGTLTFLANGMEPGHAQPVGDINHLFAPFTGAVVGQLEIGSEIERIPELFVCDAVLTMEELHITQERVGAFAFSGTEISIGTLLFDPAAGGLAESYYSTEKHRYWEQFSGSGIGTVKLETPTLRLDRNDITGRSAIHAPLEEARVGTVKIGAAVQEIPDYFLNNAVMEMDALELHTPVIGACAFASENIVLGTLTVGAEVTTFGQSPFSTDLYHIWNQFQGCKIAHLVYGAQDASLVSALDATGHINDRLDGPFEDAVIDAFTLTEDVTGIPDYLLKDASASIDELELNMEQVGALAFYGENITIGKLILGEQVGTFRLSANSDDSYLHWEQFGLASIDEVYFNVPALVLEGETTHDNDCRGLFYQSRIGQLNISGAVERIPAYCFLGAYLDQDALDLHAKAIGTRAFAGSNIVLGTLTIGEEVETFERVERGIQTFFRQFENCSIANLVYLPKRAVTGSSCYAGIFENAVIGGLTLGEAVQEIPNYLFYNAVMELEEFRLDVPVVGYYSFAGSNILFHELTVGEHVTTFLANSSNYSRAFDGCTIEQLIYDAAAAQMETLSGSVYGPFSNRTVIKGLVIGEQVTVIPYGCFRNARMDIGELTITNAAIGYRSFYGSNINIGTLNIGKNVGWQGTVYDEMDCFYNAHIGTLNYNSNAVEPDWYTGLFGKGMFAYAYIGQLNIGEDVEIIPAYWFSSATLAQDTLTIPCGWSYRSFDSSSINVGTLVLNGDLEEISYAAKQNQGFGNMTADTVVYDIPSARVSASGLYVGSIFQNTKVTNLVLGEHVEYFDVRLFRDMAFQDCYIYPVRAADGYLDQDFSVKIASTAGLHVHRNSDFTAYFDKGVSAYDWMCADHFEKAYGAKVYDEGSGTYAVEVFKTCSICGYEEASLEELDCTYDVYLSIPVGIDLTFDEQTKSFTGSAEIYAYGTLGNAYEGVRLWADRDMECYGKAVMGGGSYDISRFLSVGFSQGEAAVFPGKLLFENAAYVEAGEMEHVCREQMTVSVNALAFLESGAGDYEISISVRVELVERSQNAGDI